MNKGKKCNRCKSTENVSPYFFDVGRTFKEDEDEDKDGNNTYLLMGTGNFCRKCEKKLNNFIKKFFR